MSIWNSFRNCHLKLIIAILFLSARCSSIYSIATAISFCNSHLINHFAICICAICKSFLQVRLVNLVLILNKCTLRPHFGTHLYKWMHFFVSQSLPLHSSSGCNSFQQAHFATMSCSSDMRLHIASALSHQSLRCSSAIRISNCTFQIIFASTPCNVWLRLLNSAAALCKYVTVEINIYRWNIVIVASNSALPFYAANSLASATCNSILQLHISLWLQLKIIWNIFHMANAHKAVAAKRLCIA